MPRPRRINPRIAAQGVRLAGTGEVVMPSKSLTDGFTGPKRRRQALPAANTDADGRTAVLNTMSEAELQKHVREALEDRGWTVWVVPDMRRTMAGLPDIMAVHPDRPVLLALELKREDEHPKPKQAAALRALGRVPGVIARVVRPSTWPVLLATIDVPLIRTALEHGSEGE